MQCLENYGQCMPILLRIDCFSLFCFPNRITAEKDMHTFNAILKAFVSFRKLLRYRDNNLCISSLCQIYFKYNFCKYYIWKRYLKLAAKKRAFEGFLDKDILKKGLFAESGRHICSSAVFSPLCHKLQKIRYKDNYSCKRFMSNLRQM